MKILSAIAAAAATLCVSVSAHAALTTVNFTEAEFGGDGVAASTEYSASGINFADVVYYDNAFDPIDGRGIINGTIDVNGDLVPATGVVQFVNPVSIVMFEWIALAADQNIAVAALDINGDIIDLFIGNTGNMASGMGSVTGSMIFGLIFRAEVPESYGISTLTFGNVDPVPLPGAAVLFGSVAVFGALRRRKKA